MLSFFVIQDVHNTYFNISVLEIKIFNKKNQCALFWHCDAALKLSTVPSPMGIFNQSECFISMYLTFATYSKICL